MANTVETVFRLKDLEPYLRGIEAAKKATISLDASKSLSAPQPSISNDALMRKAQADIKRYQSDQIKAEKELTKQFERETKARADNQIREAKRANLTQIAELKQLGREQKRIDADRAQMLASLRSGVATGVVAGAGGLVLVGKEAIDRTKEAENANRALTSSATEAGKAYAVSAKEALQFGRDAAISSKEAFRATAELQRLLTLAGKPGEFQKYSKGFLDVASARGVEFSELGTLFQGIISGSDDALNRFGKADPSKLAEDYAKKIGKLTKDLTEQEKIQSRLAAFEKDFLLFAGKNAERLQETSGATDQLAKSLNDLADNFSLALTQSSLFRDNLSLLNEMFKTIAGYDPITVRIRLQEGEDPRKLAEEANSGFWNSVWRGTKAIASGIPAVGVLGYDIVTGNPNAYANYKGAIDPGYIYNRDVDATESEFRRMQQALQKQGQQAELQRAQQSPDIYMGWQKAQLEAFKKAEEEKNKINEQTVKETLEREKKLAEERKRRAEEYKRKLLEVKDVILSSYSISTQNPYVSIFQNAGKEIERVKELTKGFNSQIQRTALSSVQNANFANLTRQRFDTAQEVFDLRQKAAEFTNANQPVTMKFADGGTNLIGDFETRLAYARKEMARRLNPNLTDDQIEQQERLRKQINNIRGQTLVGGTKEQQAIFEAEKLSRLANIFQNQDASTIPNEYRKLGAEILNAQADARAREESQAAQMVTSINGLIDKAKGLKVYVDEDLAFITIQNESDRARVEARGKPSNVAKRYK